MVLRNNRREGHTQTVSEDCMGNSEEKHFHMSNVEFPKGNINIPCTRLNSKPLVEQTLFHTYDCPKVLHKCVTQNDGTALNEQYIFPFGYGIPCCNSRSGETQQASTSMPYSIFKPATFAAADSENVEVEGDSYLKTEHRYLPIHCGNFGLHEPLCGAS